MNKSQRPNPSTPEIRPLRSEDLEAVIAIDTALSGLSRRGFFEKRLRAAIDAPRDYVYVGLLEDGRLTGFAMARLVEGEFGKPGARAMLDAIGVEHKYQSHGDGHKLLDEVKNILTHKGVKKLESQVDWADHTLLRFLGDAGFQLAPRMILTRPTDELVDVPNRRDSVDPNPTTEVDHSSPNSDDFTALSRDRIPVRSMKKTDLASIIRIDRKLSGAERTAYFKRKQHEVMVETGVRVSVVAELDGFAVGYIMARVDFGEFGHTITKAVMDTIGVDPGYQGQGVALALMSQLMNNLAVLRVEMLRTEVSWNDVNAIAFFSKAGFQPSQCVSLSCPL